MAINVFGGRPNAIVAKASASFASLGINSGNTAIIYLVDNPLQSYVPGRSINGISGFVNGKGYYMVALADQDLSSTVVPPVTSLTQLGTPGSFTAAHSGSSGMALNWNAVTSATGYVLQRALDSGFTSGLTTLVSGSNVLTFTDSGLSALTQYFYRVKAQASGFSDSNYATANDTTAAGSSFVIDDSFAGSAATNLTAHTPTTGGAITKVWSTTGNTVLDGSGFAKAAATDSVKGEYGYANNFSGANQRATIVFKKAGLLPGGSPVDVIQLIIRGEFGIAGEQGYGLQLYDDGTKTYHIVYKFVNGAATPLTSATPADRPALRDGSAHTAIIEITGSTITFTLDGTVISTVTDSALTLGRQAALARFCTNSAHANVWLIDSLLGENI